MNTLQKHTESEAMPIFRGFSVGLTGGIGCGKTTVAQIFERLGAHIIDTDTIARALTSTSGKALPLIAETFGNEFLTKDGEMNRVTMRQLVFQNKQAKTQLEHILHPLIYQEAQLQAAKITSGYPIFVVPLLTESKRWKNKVSRVLAVDCSEEDQIARVMQRNQYSRQEVESIMTTQATRAERLAFANDIIHNQANLLALEPQIERLHALYSTLAQAQK